MIFRSKHSTQHFKPTDRNREGLVKHLGITNNLTCFTSFRTREKFVHRLLNTPGNLHASQLKADMKLNERHKMTKNYNKAFVAAERDFQINKSNAMMIKNLQEI